MVSKEDKPVTIKEDQPIKIVPFQLVTIQLTPEQQEQLAVLTGKSTPVLRIAVEDLADLAQVVTN